MLPQLRSKGPFYSLVKHVMVNNTSQGCHDRQIQIKHLAGELMVNKCSFFSPRVLSVFLFLKRKKVCNDSKHEYLWNGLTNQVRGKSQTF